jgi:glycosyltransferase involved in cell wall biosynthesis
MCRVLSSHFRLTLLSLCESQEEMLSPLPDDGIFDQIERIYLPRWRSIINTLLALPRRDTPLQVAYYRSPTFRKRLKTLVPQHDAVLAHLIRTGDAVRFMPVTKFLEMTDAISLNYARVREESGSVKGLRAMIYRLEASRLTQYEQEIVDDFDHSFLVSSVDRAFLFDNYPSRKKRVTVASNGVDPANLPYSFLPGTGDLAFIGDMRTLPNHDAVLYMASSVLPRIRLQYPDLNFRVIGRIGPADKARLESLDGVIVTGQVDSVGQAAEGCAIGVCPMRLGAGVQNKILEYMALGLPVVSTPLGLEGLQARDGHELMIANTASELADCILGLLGNRERARLIAEAARAYVEEQHSWSARLAPVIEQIQSALEPGIT